jgi:hypothetical protein
VSTVGKQIQRVSNWTPAPWVCMVFALAGAGMLWQRRFVYRVLDNSLASIGARPRVGPERWAVAVIRKGFLVIALGWTVAGLAGVVLSLT